jgi:ribonucleoside-diphosphate reductase beta chain
LPQFIAFHPALFLVGTRITASRQPRPALLARVFDEAENPFPDVGNVDLKKEKNFFEARVIEYQNGGALGWE